MACQAQPICHALPVVALLAILSDKAETKVRATAAWMERFGEDRCRTQLAVYQVLEVELQLSALGLCKKNQKKS